MACYRVPIRQQHASSSIFCYCCCCVASLEVSRRSKSTSIFLVLPDIQARMRSQSILSIN